MTTLVPNGATNRSSLQPTVLGVDIGGANLKLADTLGGTCELPFALWRAPQELSAKLVQLGRRILHDAPLEHTHFPATHLAVTMTGELADCYRTRSAGVQAILAATAEAAQALRITHVAVYGIPNIWLSITQACDQPLCVAASNWHALAQWIAELDFQAAGTQRNGLVIDIGSTTIDVVPIVNGSVATPAKSDLERLQLGQLVYSGMQRTPVAAMLHAFDLPHGRCPVMAELFATVDDAYLLLGLVAEAPNDCQTANGQPRTAAAAAVRLARMIGEDVETLSDTILQSMAAQVLDAQVQQLEHAIATQFQTYGTLPLIVSGHGQPLFDRWRKQTQLPITGTLQLAACLGADVSRAGPARAVADLYQRHLLLNEQPQGPSVLGTHRHSNWQ